MEIKNKLGTRRNVFGRSVPVFAILLVALIATGSAALLATYGTVATEADIEQSIVIDGQEFDEDAASVTLEHDLVAGETATDTVDVTNNANVDAMVYWGEDDAPYGIEQTIYRMEDTLTYDLEVHTDGESGDVGDIVGSVTADADFETVTYTLDLPDVFEGDHAHAANADLEVSTPEGANYHIKYSSDEHTDVGFENDPENNWAFYKPSVSKEDVVTGAGDIVAERDEIIALEQISSHEIEITVAREHLEDQTFAVNGWTGGEEIAYATSGEAFYDDESTAGHEDAPTAAEVDRMTAFMMNADSTVEFLFVTEYPINLAPTDEDDEDDKYSFEVGLHPSTQDGGYVEP